MQDLVADRRRHPSTCLYCNSAPTTEEHAIPHAMGGRLRARILCAFHNTVASRADKALCEWFAPVTHMLATPKQGGGRGSSFRASSADGEPFKIESDGRVVDVTQRVELDDRGLIARAEGSRTWAERQQTRKLRQNPDAIMPLIELRRASPTVTVHLGMPAEVEPGLVKTAMHFIAGFVTDSAVPDDIRAVILGNNPSEESGIYIRPIPFEPPLFGSSWPPSHEITAYPGPDGTYVTMMLYGVYSLVVRLPGVIVPSAVRYVQQFDRSGPLIVDIPNRPIRWSEPMSDQEWDTFQCEFNARVDRVLRYRQACDDHNVCVRAAREAHKNQAKYAAAFLDLFRAELDLCSWSTAKKDEAVQCTRRLLEARTNPWDVPTTDEPGGPGYGDFPSL
jgi:hypothetical protein